VRRVVTLFALGVILPCFAFAGELRVQLQVEPGLERAGDAWKEPYKFLLLARAANAVPEAHAFRSVVIGPNGELRIASLGNGFITDAQLRSLDPQTGVFEVKAKVNILGLQKEVVGQARADFSELQKHQRINLSVEVPDAVLELVAPRAQRFFGKILTPEIQRQMVAYLSQAKVLSSGTVGDLNWKQVLTDAQAQSWKNPGRARECEPGLMPTRWQQIQAGFVFIVWALILPLAALTVFWRSIRRSPEN
jgi:hypothetical protein